MERIFLEFRKKYKELGYELILKKIGPYQIKIVMSKDDEHISQNVRVYPTTKFKPWLGNGLDEIRVELDALIEAKEME